jgi:membrane-bound metal-dependent hydrolase YbcI (DUF457 family)
MADFRVHLAGGIAVGAGMSLTGYYMAGLTSLQTGAVFVAGSVGGLLPDLDSDTGKPLAFLFHLVSVLIPSLLFVRAVQIGGDSPEFLVCYFAGSYLFINYVVCTIVKKVTVHRGMMHSIPFVFVCAGVACILFKPSGTQVAAMAGFAVFLGCLVHLALDEITSFKLKFGFIPVPKRSSGSAFKFKSDSLFATLFIYLVLVVVVLAVFVPTLGSSAF